MVEVDGDEGGQEDQHHAGWIATADLLGGQVDLMIIFITYFSPFLSDFVILHFKILQLHDWYISQFIAVIFFMQTGQIRIQH